MIKDRGLPMEGYDKRVRMSQVQKARYVRLVGTGTERRSSSSKKRSQVISWRDDIEGQPILDQTMDPYGYFLNSSAALRRRKAFQANSLGKDEPSVVDTGHAFRVIKEETSTSLGGTNLIWWANNTQQYIGGPGICVNAEPLDILKSQMPFRFLNSSGLSTVDRFTSKAATPSLGNLQDFGKSMISNLAPNKPHANVFASIGELLVGFPKVPLAQFHLESYKATWRRRGADEFLNFVFGVSPTVSDATSIVRAMFDMHKSLLQLQRDSGRGVRRRLQKPTRLTERTFYPLELKTQGNIQYGNISDFGFDVKNQAVGTLHVPYGAVFSSTLKMVKEETYSFSGSFSYFVPQLPINNWDLGRLTEDVNRYLRFLPSATSIWQIIPWSWLLDWFFDIQGSLSLAERINDESLVINYAYAMLTTKLAAEQHTQVTSQLPGYPTISECRTNMSYLQKERIRANPYGFINQGDFDGINSPIRAAILAAIGITKAPRGGYN